MASCRQAPLQNHLLRECNPAITIWAQSGWSSQVVEVCPVFPDFVTTFCEVHCSGEQRTEMPWEHLDNCCGNLEKSNVCLLNFCTAAARPVSPVIDSAHKNYFSGNFIPLAAVDEHHGNIEHAESAKHQP